MTLLNRQECSALRGLAIIGIFLHNYLHWLGGMARENEYQFKQGNVDFIIGQLSNPSWDLPFQLISFFGHYGVPVFVFLSGYGLYMKYEQNAATAAEGRGTDRTFSATECLKWLWKHFMKLFPMMVFGFACFAMVDWMTPGRHLWSWDAVIEQMTMTINVFPDPDHNIWPGPYWYFGLMMQLYIVYVLFMRGRHWGCTVALMVACTIIQMTCFDDPAGDAINRIRYNFMGNMVPFGMGWLVARLPRPQMSLSPLAVCVASVAAVCLCSLNFWTWLAAPVFVVASNVAFAKLLSSHHIMATAYKGLYWMGGLSSAIFVCHPITRKVIISMSRHGELVGGLLIYIIATIILAQLFQRIQQKNS